jgi:hypothetical protein
MARFQVDAGGLGDDSGTLFVFGGHQQVINIGVDIDGNFFAATEITTTTTTTTGEQQTAPPPRSSVRGMRFGSKRKLNRFRDNRQDLSRTINMIAVKLLCMIKIKLALHNYFQSYYSTASYLAN